METVSLARVWDSLRRRPIAWLGLVVALVVIARVITLAAGDDASVSEEQAAPGSGASPPTSPAPERGTNPTGREREIDPPPRRRRVPTNFQATEASVRRLVIKELGPTAKGGYRRVRSVRCTGSRCTIRYVLDQPGRGKALEEQRYLWKVLFSDRRLKQATIVARAGPTTASDGREQPGSFTVSCTRARTRTVDWDTITAERLAALCRTHQAPTRRL
jgi:hypothetical protein